MTTNSFAYLVFVGFVFITFYLVKGKYRWSLLLLASLIFYASQKAPNLLLALALVIFLLAAMFPSLSSRIVDWLIAHLLPKRWRKTSSSLSHRFLSGLESLRSPQEALMIFFTSLVIWLLETGKYWLVLQAFPIKGVSFFALMLMNGIVNLATTLPSAPGYIGTFDAPGIALLQAYGVKGAVAAGYTLVLHGALWLPITLVGAFFFMREGLSLTKAMESARKEQEPKL